MSETQKAMNKSKPVNAQVHRFGELVAVWLGRGETAYLTPKEARQFARALNRAAKSCETESFVNSTCGTAAFTFGKP